MHAGLDPAHPVAELTARAGRLNNAGLAAGLERKPSASPARHGTYQPVIKVDASAAHALLPGEVHFTAHNDAAGALRTLPLLAAVTCWTQICCMDPTMLVLLWLSLL